MTCKDCIHYDVCKDLAETLEMEGCICNNFYHFKDKASIVELPCKVTNRFKEKLTKYCHERCFDEL